MLIAQAQVHTGAQLDESQYSADLADRIQSKPLMFSISSIAETGHEECPRTAEITVN